MNIPNSIRGLFRAKSDLALAVEELEQAKRERLQAQTAQEYYSCQVQYHCARIERLSLYIETSSIDQPRDLNRAS